MTSRDDIIQALGSAETLNDQIALVAQLDEHDSIARTAAATQRNLDWTNTVVGQTLAPMPTLDRHTASSDWLEDVRTETGDHHQKIVAEAAAWWNRLHPEVKADAEEFTIQAHGMARRTASRFGDDAAEARENFWSYVAFLNRQVLAASGLPQVQQEVDALENPSPTPLPDEVFPTFAEPVHPLNQAVDGQQTNSLGPGTEEAMAASGGAPSAGRPSEHDEGGAPVSQPYLTQASASYQFGEGITVTADQLHRARENAARQGHAVSFIRTEGSNDNWYGTCDGCKGAILVTANGTNDHLGGRCNNRLHTVLGSGPSVAIGQTMNAADYQALVAEGMARPFDGAPAQGREVTAASGLPQIQQTTDSHDNPSATPMPLDTMWPIDQPWDEPSTIGTLTAGGEGVAPSRTGVPSSTATRHTADTWQGGDAPAAVPGGQDPVANGPQTTPPRSNGGDYAKGMAEGRADAIASRAPSFADASSHASDYVRGYTEGFGGSPAMSGPQTVPSGVGGDNGQAVNFAQTQERQEKPLAFSASLLTKDVSGDEDFQRGYRYARSWSPGDPLVALGSAGEEAGIYAGITDAPMLQRAWVAEHRATAKQHPELRERISTHRQVTAAHRKSHPQAIVQGLYVQAASSIDLDTYGPSTSPDPHGATPIEGPGTIPILRDAPGTPAAQAGPAPYNGAGPFGMSVIPNPSIQDLNAEPEVPDSPDAVNMTGDGSMINHNHQSLAFRKKIQAAKLARRQQTGN